MTTLVDTIVSGLDTNWDATIITKPPIISKRIDRSANWYSNIKGIAKDSVLVEQEEDAVPEIYGIDGGGTYYSRTRTIIKIITQTPGIAPGGGDSLTQHDRLKGLRDAIDDALSDMSGSGYLYRRMRHQDQTPKGSGLDKWMEWIWVEVTTPASSATLSGSGHALDSHSDVTTLTEAKGDMLVHNGTSWNKLAIGSDEQVLTVATDTPAWEASVSGSDVFRTVSSTGEDVVADSSTDTLTLTSANAALTIAGTAATDTILFTLVEGSIDHDALTNFVANEHLLPAAIDHDALLNFVANEHLLPAAIDHDALLNTHDLTTDIDHNTITNNHNLTTDIDHDALTNFVANEHLLPAAIDHDALLNFVANEHLLPAAIDHDALLNFAANEHFTEASIDHTAITNIGTNTHAQIDTHVALTNEHVDHTGVTITTGDGLQGGGDISSNRTFSVDLKANSGLVIDTGELSLATTAMTLNVPVTDGIPWLDGSNNDVDMVWDWDNTNHHQSVKCTVNNADDDGDWVWRVVLPSDWQSWQSDAIKVYNYVSDTTDAGVTISVSDGTDTHTATRAQLANWAAGPTTITSASLSGDSVAASAGSTLIIKAHMDGDASDICYVGSLELYYNRD